MRGQGRAGNLVCVQVPKAPGHGQPRSMTVLPPHPVRTVLPGEGVPFAAYHAPHALDPLPLGTDRWNVIDRNLHTRMVRQIIVRHVASKAKTTTRDIQYMHLREHNQHLAARHVIDSGTNLRDRELLPPVLPCLFVGTCMRKHRPGITRICQISVPVDEERN